MKRTLWSMLIVCYLVTVVLVFLFLNTYGMNLLEKRLIKDKEDLLVKEANLINSEYMANLYDKKLTQQEFATQLKSIDTYLNIRVWIVNPGGVVIIDSDARSNIPLISINEIDPTFLDKTISVNTRLGNVLKEPMLSVIQTVNYNYQFRGYIVLHTPMSSIRETAVVYFDIINICLLLFFPILLAIFVYIYFLTVKPMRHLIKAAMEYSAGNFDYQINMRGSSEFRELGATLTYMANELSQLDNYRKKFVANISHDFRSPLTSIKGYVQAMLDGTIPQNMQEKYLGIILFETERLNKLTASLLELNQLENRGALLDIVSFDINHIIKKTAESFEGACRSKKVTLNLVFASEETYVDADVGKIQQVLYNLLDNAIKFSHNNSKIKISTEEKGEKVFVSVKDYGIGIPKDSIKKIWERFYKTDASRGRDKKGTGLGLSITKEIIQAHNENINVISTEGVGSEFIFTLKKTVT